MNEASQIEIRSDEVQEIMTIVPHWIVRWGISVILITCVMLFLVGWILKYPEIITSNVSITTQNPPVPVIARSTGKLYKLLVNENQFVKSGTTLAAIENPANLDDVLQLNKVLETSAPMLATPEKMVDLELNPNVNLGELQADYSSLLKAISDYRLFIKTNYLAEKIASVNAQIESYNALQKKLEQRKQTLQQEVDLGKKKYDANKSLFDQGLISESDLSNLQSVYLQKKSDLQEVEGDALNNNIQLADHQKALADLDQEFDEKKANYTIQIEEAYKRFQSSFASWDQKYLLRAPIDGRVAFYKFWSSNQFVRTGDEVMTIVPGAQQLIGKVYLPLAGSGKVKVGQRVNIKFEDYPFREFGIVRGRVDSISLVARENKYLVNVSLPDGLRTSYSKNLEFKQEMQGTSEIITEDRRLVTRVFYQFRSVFTN